MRALTANSPMRGMQWIAKQYGKKSPGVVMDTFFLLSDLAGIERPQVEGPAARIWYHLAFRRGGGRDTFLRRRELLWDIGPDARIIEATQIPFEYPRFRPDAWSPALSSMAEQQIDVLRSTSQKDLMKGLLDWLSKKGESAPEMFERQASDAVWPWVARELNRAKKRDMRDRFFKGVPNEYQGLLFDLEGKGPALALWKQEESVDFNKTSAAEALEALKTFTLDVEVEQGEVVYEWEDGWTIQELTDSEQVVDEGEQMQHCVGDYCEDVIAGDMTVYSLRDPSGKPHATMDVKRGATRFSQVKGKQNAPPRPEYQKRIDQFGEAMDIGPAVLTDDEKYRAIQLGVEMAERSWSNSQWDVVDRESEDVHIDEDMVESWVFESSHVDPYSELWEAALEAVRESADDAWEDLYKETMQGIDDTAEMLAEEAQAHLEEYGDFDDFDFEKIAESYLWDIDGSGPLDAEYVATGARIQVGA